MRRNAIAEDYKRIFTMLSDFVKWSDIQLYYISNNLYDDALYGFEHTFNKMPSDKLTYRGKDAFPLNKEFRNLVIAIDFYNTCHIYDLSINEYYKMTRQEFKKMFDE